MVWRKAQSEIKNWRKRRAGHPVWV